MLKFTTVEPKLYGSKFSWLIRKPEQRLNSYVLDFHLDSGALYCIMGFFRSGTCLPFRNPWGKPEAVSGNGTPNWPMTENLQTKFYSVALLQQHFYHVVYFDWDYYEQRTFVKSKTIAATQGGSSRNRGVGGLIQAWTKSFIASSGKTLVSECEWIFGSGQWDRRRWPAVTFPSTCLSAGLLG